MIKLPKAVWIELIVVLALVGFTFGELVHYSPEIKPTLGAAVPSTPALYDGYLVSSILASDTSMTITPSTLLNGSSLSGYMCFVIDVNQPTVEYICGTASGGTISSLARGVDVLNPNATSSALAFAHRRFASVSVSDYPTIQYMVRKLNGTDSFDTALTYASTTSFGTTTNSLVTASWVNGAINTASSSAYTSILNTANTFTQLQTFGAGLTSNAASSFTSALTALYATASSSVVTNGRLNDIVIAGAPNASVTAKGIVQIATQLQIASSTGTCSAGAPCVISADNATSTYNPATAGLRLIATENNGKINAGFIPAVAVATSTVFGDGSDGDVTISSGTTTLIRDMYYNNLTITGTLVTASYRVFVKGTLSGSGYVTWGIPANGATPAGGAATTTGGVFRNAKAGNGQTNGSGGVAGNATSTCSGGSSGNATTSPTIPCGVFTFNTFNHLDQTAISSAPIPTWTYMVSGMGGQGGTESGAGDGATGGGGASCGGIFIAAYTWAGTFTIYCNGGSGAAAVGSVSNQVVPGQGGSGGEVWAVFGIKTWTGTYLLKAGRNGAINGSGGGGGTGTVAPDGRMFEIPINTLL